MSFVSFHGGASTVKLTFAVPPFITVRRPLKQEELQSRKIHKQFWIRLLELNEVVVANATSLRVMFTMMEQESEA